MQKPDHIFGCSSHVSFCQQNADHLVAVAASLFILALRFSYFKFNKHLFTPTFCQTPLVAWDIEMNDPP